MPGVDSPTFSRPPLADQPWPVEDLELAPECMVCGGRERSAWRTELSDRVFRTSPGGWTLWRCGQCGAAQLDPRPTPAAIGRAYSAYYTHQGPEKNFLVPGDRPDLRLKRALHLSFYNRRTGIGIPAQCRLAGRRSRPAAGEAHVLGSSSGICRARRRTHNCWTSAVATGVSCASRVPLATGQWVSSSTPRRPR